MQNSNERVRRHRDAQRAAGLRPVQFWVPDTRAPEFAAQAARDCARVAAAEADDAAIEAFSAAALADLLPDWPPLDERE